LEKFDNGQKYAEEEEIRLRTVEKLFLFVEQTGFKNPQMVEADWGVTECSSGYVSI